MDLAPKIRKAIGARAEYLYYIYEELSLEFSHEVAEKVLRRAVRRYGRNVGRRMGPITDASVFVRKLEEGNPAEVFGREFPVRDPGESVMKLNYCPMVDSWQKLGAPREKVSLLCSIAMEGDFGMFDDQPVTMYLDSSIGDGDSCCIMRVKRPEGNPKG
jgi:hypothetical protein